MRHILLAACLGAAALSSACATTAVTRHGDTQIGVSTQTHVTETRIGAYSYLEQMVALFAAIRFPGGVIWLSF